MEYDVISGEQIRKKDIEGALLLDRLVYPQKYWLNVQTCLSYLRKNSDIYVMLKKDGSIVAYFCMFPVEENCYESIKKGLMNDTCITADMVLPFEKNSLCDLYFSSLVVHPDHRNAATLKILLEKAVEKFESLAKNGVFIKRMVADAVSNEGIKVCQLFGMKKLECESNVNPYEVNFLPPEFRVFSQKTKFLYDLYFKKANQLNLI